MTLAMMDNFTNLWRTLIRVGLVGAYAAGAAILIVLGWWAFVDTKPPMRIIGEEYAETREVKRGQYLIVVRNYCVDRPERGHVNRRIVDGVVWQLPSLETPGEVGCFEKQRVFIDLPIAIPPGPYELRESISYRPNPITVATVAHQTIKFQVVE